MTLWRSRYDKRGLTGLDDFTVVRSVTTIDAAKRHQVLSRTLLAPPAGLGVTHWSSRLLARKVGLHFTQVAATWRDSGASQRSTGPHGG